MFFFVEDCQQNKIVQVNAIFIELDLIKFQAAIGHVLEFQRRPVIFSLSCRVVMHRVIFSAATFDTCLFHPGFGPCGQVRLCCRATSVCPKMLGDVGRGMKDRKSMDNKFVVLWALKSILKYLTLFERKT